MRYKTVLRTGVLAAAMALAFAAQAKDWSKIRIGTEGAYPPFNFIDSAQQLQGFDVDIAKAICDKEKVSCDVVAQDWDGLIPALLAGKYDAIFASMSITDERKKNIAFSSKYYSSPALFVAQKSDAGLATTPDGMKGKTLGAQSATVSARYLQEVFAPAGVEVKLYATQDEANLDLASGRVDAVLADKVVMLPWLEKSPDGQCCQIVGQDVSDPKYFGEGIGAGMRKDDTDLKALIDKGIADIRADGTYDRINAKYFPFSLY
ncbi:MAG: lysine/arginine/ornithine ABC transporter substrate-binding protein [Hansschlegelia sp.]